MMENETERFLKNIYLVLLRPWHNASLLSYLYTTWILWSSLYVSIEYCLCFHINRKTIPSLWIWLKLTPKRYIYCCDLSGLPLASLLKLLIWLQEVVAWTVGLQQKQRHHAAKHCQWSARCVHAVVHVDHLTAHLRGFRTFAPEAVTSKHCHVASWTF